MLAQTVMPGLRSSGRAVRVSRWSVFGVREGTKSGLARARGLRAGRFCDQLDRTNGARAGASFRNSGLWHGASSDYNALAVMTGEMMQVLWEQLLGERPQAVRKKQRSSFRYGSTTHERYTETHLLADASSGRWRGRAASDAWP